jgi:hypothetical protein
VVKGIEVLHRQIFVLFCLLSTLLAMFPRKTVFESEDPIANHHIYYFVSYITLLILLSTPISNRTPDTKVSAELGTDAIKMFP